MTSPACDGLEQLCIGYLLHVAPRVAAGGKTVWRAWVHGAAGTDYSEAETPLDAAIAAARGARSRKPRRRARPAIATEAGR